ncbi:uncharacterized protein HaLaN_23150, partial [Haematococcus lacustris]
MDHARRPVLRQLPETPLRMDDPAKRQRIAYQTPVHGTSALNVCTPGTLPGQQQAGGGDILDYLKGRGGRIKELEDEVSRQRAANEQLTAALAQASAAQSKLQLQLSMAEQQCAAAKAASATASSAASATAKPSAYIAQLEQLVDSELAKGLALETQLAAAQERLLQAEQRTAAAKEQASAAAAEAHRSAAALGVELEA